MLVDTGEAISAPALLIGWNAKGDLTMLNFGEVGMLQAIALLELAKIRAASTPGVGALPKVLPFAGIPGGHNVWERP